MQFGKIAKAEINIFFEIFSSEKNFKEIFILAFQAVILAYNVYGTIFHFFRALCNIKTIMIIIVIVFIVVTYIYLWMGQ